ncbi:TetR family transcriptional regulator C-terminal domain-containing protein [Flaviaesturariibacter amylovorans]|uniref:TetR/AcrR family transcriptional regulator n=1 Tax=Flaviaesturariibacter amylovorans TaxID=1084520 RepID=A0ABP8GCD5_9BACT
MTLSKAERTRQLIIEKAAPLFNRKGYADTSLQDVVAATGLTKGAIYGNFANKDELALSVFDYNLSALKAGMAAALASEVDAAAKLIAFAGYYRSAFKGLAARGGCPVLNAATEADDNYPLLRPRVRAAIRSWEKAVTQVIVQGQEQGRIRKGIDAGRYATLFIALIEGGIMLSKIMDDPARLETALAQVEHLVRHELAT